MKRIKKSTSVKIIAFSLCIFSASVLVAYGIKTRSFTGIAKSEDNFSGTLYMSLKSDTASPDISLTESIQSEETATAPETDSNVPESSASPEFSLPPTELLDIEYVNVLFTNENRTERMLLEDYVAAVVAAEMPSSASPEALKAQAVACRTLAVNLIFSGDKSAHEGADICTSAGHCQSFSTKASFTEKYGEAGAKCYDNAVNATKATKGIILLYNSKPIVAAFHASSGEYTASSKEIWGGSLDYLVSVKSPESESESYSSKVFERKTFSRDNFINKLKKAGVSNISQYADKDFHQWISSIVRTDSGRVSHIEIGGQKISGNTIKNLFGLRSTDFSVSFAHDSVTFETRGYGHGVGMSQLGAATMAENGFSFYDILTYYYPGVSFGIVGK